jgi:hypothetical protein
MKRHIEVICPDCGDGIGRHQSTSDNPDYECVLEGGCVNCHTHVIQEQVLRERNHDHS